MATLAAVEQQARSHVARAFEADAAQIRSGGVGAVSPGPLLVPLDGSALAERALPWAAALAAARPAPLLLARVVERRFPSAGDAQVDAALAETIVRTELELAARYLEEQAAALRTTGVGLLSATEVRLGDPANELLAIGHERRVQLVVMSARARSGIAQWLRGSVAEQVLRRGRAPILLVPPGLDPAQAAALGRPGVRVLVPLDGSYLAVRALPEARRVGGGAAEVVLTAVLDGAELGSGPEGAASWASSPRAVARAYLDGVVEALRQRNCAARSAILAAGDVASAIADQAIMSGAHLIAMSTHGRGGLGRWLYGSTADRVARMPVAPVLLYRPPAAAPAAP